MSKTDTGVVDSLLHCCFSFLVVDRVTNCHIYHCILQIVISVQLPQKNDFWPDILLLCRSLSSIICFQHMISYQLMLIMQTHIGCSVWT